MVNIPDLDQICRAWYLNLKKASANCTVTNTTQILQLKKIVFSLLFVSLSPFWPEKRKTHNLKFTFLLLLMSFSIPKYRYIICTYMKHLFLIMRFLQLVLTILVQMFQYIIFNCIYIYIEGYVGFFILV